LKLSDAERRQYEVEGYLIARGLLAEAEIERYKTRARQFALGEIPPGAEKMVVRDVRVARGEFTPEDPEKGLWKYLHPDRHDPLFRGFAETPAILDVVESLLGPDVLAFLTMFIYKPPGVDAVHHYHQDAFYFPFGPHDQVLGSWVTLDPAEAANGGLWVIPGSHRWGLKPHVVPKAERVNAGIFGVEGADEDPNQVALRLSPGDGVFFHSRLLHKTGANVTDRHRRVLTVHYASARCAPEAPPDKLKPYEFRRVRGRTYPGCLG